MPVFPFRFDKLGLQQLPAAELQPGYLAHDNATVDRDGVVEKRAGAAEIARTTTTSPTTELPGESCHALFYRERELVLETLDSLYTYRRCAGAGSSTLGTATGGEITATQDAADKALGMEKDVTITLAGSALGTAALDRLNRDFFGVDIEYAAPSAPSITIYARLSFTGAGRLQLTWDGAGVQAGAFELPTGAGSPGHYQVTAAQGKLWVAVPPQSSRGNRADVLEYTINAFVNPSTLNIVPGPRHSDILGAPATACVGGDANGPIMIQDPGGVPFQLLEQNTPRALSAATRLLLASATSGCAFDAIRQTSGTVGVRVAFAPIRPVRTEEQAPAALLRFGLGIGTVAISEEQFDSVEHLAGARLGVALTGAGDGIAHQVEGVRHVRTRGAGDYPFDQVVGGSLVYRYTTSTEDGTTSAALVRLVAGQSFPPELLQLDVAARDDFALAFLSDGRHLATYVSRSEAIVYFFALPTLGQYAPAKTSAAGVCVTAAADGVALGYAWATRNPNNLQLRWTHDLVSWSSLAVPLDAAPDASSFLALTVADDGAPDVLAFAALLTPDLALAEFAITTTSSSVVPRTQQVTATNVQGLALYQSGLWPRHLLAIVGDSVAVYETTPTYFVRVDPPTVSLPGGSFARRGPWTRSRLAIANTQDWGKQIVEQTSAAAIADGDGFCVVQAVEIITGNVNTGLQVLVYSTHAETGGTAAPLNLGTAAADPHVVNCGPDLVALTYCDSGTGALSYLFWGPGQSFTTAATGIVAGVPAAPLYDLTGGLDSTGRSFYALVSSPGGAGALDLQFRDAAGPVANTTLAVTVDAVAAVAIFATQERDNAEPSIAVAWTGVVAGGLRVAVAVYRIVAGPTWDLLWSFAFDAGAAGDTPKAITVGLDAPGTTSLTTMVSVEIQRNASSEREVETWEVPLAGPATSLRVDERSALFGSYCTVRDQLAHVQSSVEVGQASNKLRRSGLFALAPRTGEIVARMGYGEVEGYVERIGNRRQVSDFNPLEQGAVLGYAVETGAVLEQLTASKAALLDARARPNCPAQLQRVLCSAHAGYPRGYDGSRVYEQDWHELPRVSAAVAIGGGSNAAGSYGYAVTWEWYDAEGNRYRSAPWFGQIDLAASQYPRLTLNALQRTERVGVVAVGWLTRVNDTTYRRSVEVDALTGGQLVLNLSTSDAALADNEPLDQVEGVLVESFPGSITDFVGTADGRFWSHDPERQELARFSTISQEGNAPHWTPEFVLDGPATLTATSELLGRVILLTLDGGGYTSGGPDNAGRGGYRYPSELSLAIGATDQCTVARIPHGLVYGTTRTPHLLTGGLTSEDMGAAISRVYEVDGDRVAVALYRPERGEVVMGNDGVGRSYRFHLGSQRWAHDPPRLLRDQARSSAQEYAVLLTDGRILTEAADIQTFDDGGAAYPLRISTPWIRLGDNPTHGQFDVVRATVLGEYLGDHDLILTLYTDYQATSTRTWRVSSATIAENAAAGRPYLYQCAIDHTCFAARLELRDNAEPTATVRLQGLDVTVQASSKRDTGLRTFHRFGD